MIKEDDYILVDKNNGDKRRLYKALCDRCGCDRGYKRKNRINSEALCRSCSQSGVQNPDNFLNVDFNDFIENSNSKSYKTKCIECKKDKGYVRKKDALKPCLSCAAKLRHENMHPSVKNKLKQRMSKSLPEDIKQKISESLSGKTFREYSPLSDECKIKISATKQGISVENFEDFKTPESQRQRSLFNKSELRSQCFENANYTCDLFQIKGYELNAHHLDSWDKSEDGRFELDNLVCLSEPAHKTFHKKYGKGNNTKEQYEEFKREIDSYIARPKQDLYIVAGCPASGKSWVCSQLKDKFNYISYDEVSKDLHIYELLKNNNKPLLFDPTIKVSTFTKRIGHLFNIKLIVIVEDETTINSRMKARGGEVTDTIRKRIKRMNDLSKKCEFSGTSCEVFDYLKCK